MVGSRCLLVGSGGGRGGSGGVEGGRQAPYNKRQDSLTPIFFTISKYVLYCSLWVVDNMGLLVLRVAGVPTEHHPQTQGPCQQSFQTGNNDIVAFSVNCSVSRGRV